MRGRSCLARAQLEIMAGDRAAAEAAEERASLRWTSRQPSTSPRGSGGCSRWQGGQSGGFEDVDGLAAVLEQVHGDHQAPFDDGAADLEVAYAVLLGRPEHATDALKRPRGGHGYSPAFNHYVRGVAWAALSEPDRTPAAAATLRSMGPPRSAVAVLAALVETERLRRAEPAKALEGAAVAARVAADLGLSA